MYLANGGQMSNEFSSVPYRVKVLPDDIAQDLQAAAERIAHVGQEEPTAARLGILPLQERVAKLDVLSPPKAKGLQALKVAGVKLVLGRNVQDAYHDLLNFQ